MLENTPNQPSKFRTKNWVEVNDESRGTYIVNSQIKFKTLMLRSRLCDYSDVYILVSATITVPNTAAAGADPNNRKNIKSKIVLHSLTAQAKSIIRKEIMLETLT